MFVGAVGVVWFCTTGGRPGPPGATLSSRKFGWPGCVGVVSRFGAVLVGAAVPGGGGGAPFWPGTGSALLLGNS
jgi:hypothetical protein